MAARYTRNYEIVENQINLPGMMAQEQVVVCYTFLPIAQASDGKRCVLLGVEAVEISPWVVR